MTILATTLDIALQPSNPSVCCLPCIVPQKDFQLEVSLQGVIPNAAVILSNDTSGYTVPIYGGTGTVNSGTGSNTVNFSSNGRSLNKDNNNPFSQSPLTIPYNSTLNYWVQPPVYYDQVVYPIGTDSNTFGPCPVTPEMGYNITYNLYSFFTIQCYSVNTGVVSPYLAISLNSSYNLISNITYNQLFQMLIIRQSSKGVLLSPWATFIFNQYNFAGEVSFPRISKGLGFAPGIYHPYPPNTNPNINTPNTNINQTIAVNCIPYVAINNMQQITPPGQLVYTLTQP